MIVLLVKELRQLARDTVTRGCIIGIGLAVTFSAALAAHDYRAAREQYVRNLDLHIRAVGLNTAYRDLAWTGIVIDRKPNLSSILAKGVSDGLPSAATVSVGTRLVNNIDYRVVHNHWNKLAGSFDFVFIVLTCVSIFAILASYRSIAGESEAGTLPLLMSSNTTKLQLLSAKVLAPLLLIIAVLGLMVLAVVSIAATTINEPLDVNFGAAAIGLWLAASLYGAGFGALGVWMSATARRSVTALATSITVWALLVFVVPPTSIILASVILPLPSRDAVLERKQRASDEQWLRWSQRQQQYEEDHGHAAYNDVAGDWLVDRELRIAEEIARVDDAYQAQVREQLALALSLARLSPAFAFFDVATALADTGVRAHHRFYDAVRSYRAEFTTFTIDAVRRDPRIPDPSVTVDVSLVPKFIPVTVPIVEGFVSSVGSVGVLLLWPLVTCCGAIIALRAREV